MKALRGVLNPFVTSALYEDKCSASRPGYFTLREISPSSHWIGVLVGTVNGLDVSGKKKTSIFRKKIFVFIRYSFCRPVTIPTKLYLPPNLVKWDQRTKECQTVIRVQFKCDGTRWHTGGKWRGNWRMEWVASTLHTTSELGVSCIPTADSHNSAASSRLNLRPCPFKWTHHFRRKKKSGFCVCVPSHFKRSLPHWIAITQNRCPHLVVTRNTCQSSSFFFFVLLSGFKIAFWLKSVRPLRAECFNIRKWRPD